MPLGLGLNLNQNIELACDLMKVKFLKILFLFLFIFPSVFAQPSVRDWRGYITVNGMLANTSYVITSYTNGLQPTNGIIYNDGYYILHVPGSDGDNITFKICGVLAYPTNVTPQVWSSVTDYTVLNLSITTLPDGSPCTYACGCSGGYCNSGICASSPPTTTTTTPSGGGAGTTTTTTITVPTTTTTTLQPATEIKTLPTIEANTTGTFTYNTVPVTNINVSVKTTVKSVQIEVTKQTTTPATIAIAAPHTTYAYLVVNKKNISDEDITNVKIKFRVEKSWISANGIDSNTITLNKYINGVWNPLPTSKISEDSIYVYYEAISPTLSVFAITGQKVPSVKTTTTTLPKTTTTLPKTTTTKPKIPPIVVTPIRVVIIIITLIIILLIILKGLKVF